MGGPEKLSDVHSFLFNLFSDGDLIPLPFQKHLAPWIAKRRTPKIQDQYAQIGGGSPIKYWTERQGLLLEQLLDRVRPESAPHKSYVAFRYAEPMTEVAVQSMLNDGVRDVVALSLYPQYSCSTTGSSLNMLHKKVKELDKQGTLNFSVIDRWPTNSLLIEAFAKNIENSLKEIPENIRSQTVILFSAHSLPMSVVNRGDTYPMEVAATVHAVMQRLNIPNQYRLVWQSQVGPSAWLGPKTDDAIVGYAKQGKKQVLLVPIAFVSDHIETLFELDIEYQELAHKSPLSIAGFKMIYKNLVAIEADLVFEFEAFIKNDLGLNLDVDKRNVADICKFYLKGFCAKGDNCPFRHQKNEKTVVCKHWLRGLCKKGDLCEFLHEYNLKKMPECWFYSKYGECSNAECMYLHVDPESKVKECAWYARGFCKHGPKCRHKHVRKAVCQNYITGFCPLGPDCTYGHPKYELPNLNQTGGDGGEEGNNQGAAPSGRAPGRYQNLKEVTCFKKKIQRIRSEADPVV
ncbi:ferrochelatase hem15 [Phlyctochytrium bullatum]|nr:ferrochelatase hem15 [Phlyctochytrium bullatum]